MLSRYEQGSGCAPLPHKWPNLLVGDPASGRLTVSVGHRLLCGAAVAAAAAAAAHWPVVTVAQ